MKKPELNSRGEKVAHWPGGSHVCPAHRTSQEKMQKETSSWNNLWKEGGREDSHLPFLFGQVDMQEADCPLQTDIWVVLSSPLKSQSQILKSRMCPSIHI